jgi:TetR/AcrR family transcriptional repressor of nem operon
MVAEEAMTEQKGCLITNTAVECATDRAIARRVESNWDGLETALTGALVRARAQDELSGDPRALARFLVTLMQGIKVTAKVPDERRMRDAVDQALTLLA